MVTLQVMIMNDLFNAEKSFKGKRYNLKFDRKNILNTIKYCNDRIHSFFIISNSELQSYLSF